MSILRKHCLSTIVYKRFVLQTNQKISNNCHTARINCYSSTTTTTTTRSGKKSQGWVLWKGIITKFIPIGICLVAVMEWRALRKHSKSFANKWEIDIYCSLPLRSASRCWGWFAEKSVPLSMRPYIFGLYANTFGVNLCEAQNEDLKSYTCLSDFFVRELKEGVRPICIKECMVSPCDGTVLNFGRVVSNEIDQVKGVTYALKNFLGEMQNDPDNTFDYRSLLVNKTNNLYQCVIYLAPGDYHRFHSPSVWSPTHRKHIPGELLSVNPTIAKWIPGLFCINERAVYLGNWKHGFFSLSAVGATNVGSIKVYFDKSLHTNRPKTQYHCKDKCLGTNLNLNKGDPIGEFRMGSTIVLIFEAPPDFNFTLELGQKLKMGEGIGCVKDVNLLIENKMTIKNHRHSAKA